jgi:hypothetical protein
VSTAKVVGLIALAALVASGCTVDPHAPGTPTSQARAIAITSATLGPQWQAFAESSHVEDEHADEHAGEGADEHAGEGADEHADESVDDHVPGGPTDQIQDLRVTVADGRISACLPTELVRPLAVAAATTSVPQDRPHVFLDSQARIYPEDASVLVRALASPDRVPCLLNALVEALYTNPGRGVVPASSGGSGLKLDVRPLEPLTGFAIGVSLPATVNGDPVTLRLALLVTASGRGAHLTQVRVQVAADAKQGEPNDPLLWALEQASAASSRQLSTLNK